MKVALVNLAKLEDLSLSKHQEGISRFLEENGIDFLDFYSGRSGLEELLEGFHDALKSDAELIWFTQGGDKVIRFLDKIDWKLFEKSEKKFMGTSDPTHIAWKCKELELDYFYGPNAKKIYEYYPHPENRKFLVDFLKDSILPKPQIEKLTNCSSFKLECENEKIIGGHSFISIFMMQFLDVNLDGKVLFFEHHYILGESYAELLYFVDQLKLILKTKTGLPKAILLGNTYLFDEQNKMIDYREINKIIAEHLGDLQVDVFSLDHAQTIIRF